MKEIIPKVLPKNVTQKNYKASILLSLAAGIYMFGFWMGTESVKENMDATVEKFEQQSAAVNTVIVTEYVDRIKEITKWRTNNVEVIKVVPSVCELPNGWVHVHDSSAEGRNADPARAIDETPSGVEDVEALGTVVENYATCHENREQLLALQKWVTDQQQEILNMNTANAGTKEE